MPTLHSLIHRKIVVLSPYATLREAARAMCDNLIGCVLVSSPEGGAGGIITDRDLTCRWLTEEGPGAVADAEATVAQLMSRHLVVADENAGLEHVIQLMENHGVRRIPIVNTRDKKQLQKFVGIVTLDDLIAAELIPMSRLSQIVKRQLIQRTETPEPGSRSLAHWTQTLQRFYAHLNKATGVSRDRLPELTRFILGALVTRVTFAEAMHFLAQLPELLREQLLTLPLGPDREVTARKLVEEMARNLTLSENDAEATLQKFIAALRSWMTPGQLDHLRAQLSSDFHPFFDVCKSAA